MPPLLGAPRARGAADAGGDDGGPPLPGLRPPQHRRVSAGTAAGRPIQPREVVVRTQASAGCYSITPFALRTTNQPRATILNHSGAGIEEVGPLVKRVQPGDTVIVAGTPQCGQCSQCLQGRADHCQFLTNTDVHPVAQNAADGTAVVQMSGLGGISEYMVVAEEDRCPVFTDVPFPELALLADTASTGLAAGGKNLATIHPGADVVVLGCGPLGLAAVQCARIMGAGADHRRRADSGATRTGDATGRDDDARPERRGRQAGGKRIQEICRGETDRLFAGGTGARGRGADFVIEAVGGDQFPPKVEVGPDPTGITPIRQAWEMTRSGGHIVLHGIGQQGEVSFPAARFCIGGRSIHAGQQGGLNPMRDLPRYVKLIERGLFDAKAIITGTYRIDQAKQAFQDVADRTTVGAVVVF